MNTEEWRYMEAVRESDTDLLLLGFDWFLRFLFGQGPIIEQGVVE